MVLISQKKFKAVFLTAGQECISAHLQTILGNYAQNWCRLDLKHCWNTHKQHAAKKTKLNDTTSVQVVITKVSSQSD
jgi:hypothetical protein